MTEEMVLVRCPSCDTEEWTSAGCWDSGPERTRHTLYHKGRFHETEELQRMAYIDWLKAEHAKRPITEAPWPSSEAAYFSDGRSTKPDEMRALLQAVSPTNALAILDAMVAAWPTHDRFDTAAAEQSVKATADSLGLKVKEIAMVVRVATMHSKVGPPMYDALAFFRPSAVVDRLRAQADLLRLSTA